MFGGNHTNSFSQRQKSPEYLELCNKYNIQFPLEPGFYEKFPVELLSISNNNARNGAVDMRHVKDLSISMDNGGIIKPPMVDIYGTIPEGGHRTLATIALGAKFIPITVGDFESKGTLISAASDSQVKYTTYNTILSMAEIVAGGKSVESIVGVSAKRRETIIKYLKFGLNSTDELKYAVQDNRIPLSQAIQIGSELKPLDQNYLLNSILRGKIKSFRSSQVSEIKSKYKTQDHINLEDLIKRGLNHTELLLEDFNDFLVSDKKPSYDSKDDNNFFSLEHDKEQSQKNNNNNSKKIVEYLSKLYQTGVLNKRHFLLANSVLDDFYLKKLIEDVNPNSNSLFNLIKSNSRKNPLEQILYTFEEAKAKLDKGVQKDKSISLAYDVKFIEISPYEVIGSRKNVRGSLEETIASAKELVPSILEHGLLQPPLAYINELNQKEIITGNRRYNGVMLGLKQDSKNPNIQEIPLFVIEEEIIPEDVALLQIAEDSQKSFTPLEKGALYCLIRNQIQNHENTNRHKANKMALEQIAKSTPYSKNQVKRYMDFWEKLPKNIRTTFEHKLVNMDILEHLTSSNIKSKTAMTNALSQILLSRNPTQSKLEEIINYFTLENNSNEADSIDLFSELNGLNLEKANNDELISNNIANYIIREI